MTLNYTFRPEDERRLLRIFRGVTIRGLFVVLLGVISPLFVALGIMIAQQEFLYGAFVALIGLGMLCRIILQLRFESKVRSAFRTAVGRSVACAWVLDDDGISSMTGEEKMKWSSFKKATLCSEGFVLSDGDFAWIPKEAIRAPEHVQALRELVLKHGLRLEERAEPICRRQRRASARPRRRVRPPARLSFSRSAFRIFDNEHPCRA